MHTRFRLVANNRSCDFDWAGAPRAPVPEQVAEPQPSGIERCEESGVGLACRVAGNVLVGGALLACLLAAPGILGLLFGLY